MKKKLMTLAAALALTTGCAPAASAHNRWHDYDDREYGEYRGAREYYDYARVVDVDPIVRVVQVPTPHRECWSEPVTYREPGRSDSYTGTIVGGIVGGVVGHQIGEGRGKDAATIAGTLLGASVGRDLSRGSGRTYTAYEERCRTLPDYAEEERIDGYRVTYRYHGETFTTHMPYHPGNRVRVYVTEHPARLRVEPAF